MRKRDGKIKKSNTESGKCLSGRNEKRQLLAVIGGRHILVLVLIGGHRLRACCILLSLTHSFSLWLMRCVAGCVVWCGVFAWVVSSACVPVTVNLALYTNIALMSGQSVHVTDKGHKKEILTSISKSDIDWGPLLWNFTYIIKCTQAPLKSKDII